MAGRCLRLLIADDSASDIYLFKTALHEHSTAHEVYTVADGEAAIHFLRQQGRHSDAPKIDLVVLDICMPKRTGHEVLEEVKADPDLRSIPVVMLTSSSLDTDVSRAYDAHANCYIQKPNNWESWSDVVHAIESFWCNRVTLPHSG
jgi:chemotaxis family two-component system response regulator Rcp1